VASMLVASGDAACGAAVARKAAVLLSISTAHRAIIADRVKRRTEIFLEKRFMVLDPYSANIECAIWQGFW